MVCMDMCSRVLVCNIGLIVYRLKGVFKEFFGVCSIFIIIFVDISFYFLAMCTMCTMSILNEIFICRLVCFFVPKVYL